MAKHVKLPGFVPLHRYMSLEALEELERLCWLATADKSPLKAEIAVYIPEEDREERLMAIHEIGVIAQSARRKVGR